MKIAYSAISMLVILVCFAVSPAGILAQEADLSLPPAGFGAGESRVSDPIRFPSDLASLDHVYDLISQATEDHRRMLDEKDDALADAANEYRENPRSRVRYARMTKVAAERIKESIEFRQLISYHYSDGARTLRSIGAEMKGLPDYGRESREMAKAIDAQTTALQDRLFATIEEMGFSVSELDGLDDSEAPPAVQRLLSQVKVLLRNREAEAAERQRVQTDAEAFSSSIGDYVLMIEAQAEALELLGFEAVASIPHLELLARSLVMRADQVVVLEIVDAIGRHGANLSMIGRDFELPEIGPAPMDPATGAKRPSIGVEGVSQKAVAAAWRESQERRRAAPNR